MFDFQSRSNKEIIEFTPNICKHLLSEHSNPYNRNLKQKSIESLIRDINEGDFKEDLSTIFFGEDPHDSNRSMIYDGHNRLTAGSKADRGFRCQVRFNTPIEYLKRIDTGNSRTTADILTMTAKDMIKPAAITAIFNAYHKMVGNKIVAGGGKLTDEVYEFWKSNKKILVLLLDALNGNDKPTIHFIDKNGDPEQNRSIGLINANIKAPLVYAYQNHPTKAVEFIRQLVVPGAASPQSGPDLLRYRMLQGKTKGTKRTTPVALMHYTLTAFSVFLYGQKPKQLKAGEDLKKVLKSISSHEVRIAS